MSIAEKLTTIAENVPKVYEAGHARGIDEGEAVGYENGYNEGKTAGKAEENRAWWDCMTVKGTRTYFTALFRGADFNLIGGFNPPYTLKPRYTADNMFRLATGLTKITKSQLDTSGNEEGVSTFEASDLQEIEEFSTVGFVSKDIKWHFYGCSQLHTIGKFILKADGTQVFTKNFTNDTNLQNITFEGKFGSGENFSSCPKLTVKSIESIVTALLDTASGQTMTFNVAAKTTYYNAHSSEYANADEAWDALCDTKPNWTISLV